ncbi:MAG: hypothetical protein KKA79_09820, partial [Nanoarchaeota archaeon]|nr:hypothetical protein [Nanoarchaeota archaeon]
MKKYLVEFMNMNEYELCLTKLIEAEESEIMEKVKDFHVDAINSYVKDQLEEKGIDPWISDEDLDAKVRDCLEVMPQGFDFYPYQRDINFGNALEENTCYAPDGSTRYIELTDEQAKKLESLKVEGDQQLQ